jgi:hypothetical protein
MITITSRKIKKEARARDARGDHEATCNVLDGDRPRRHGVTRLVLLSRQGGLTTG